MSENPAGGLIPIEVIDRAAAMLLDAAPAGSEVILFGSYARGDAGPDSDLDFMVVEPTVTGQIAETIRLDGCCASCLTLSMLWWSAASALKHGNRRSTRLSAARHGRAGRMPAVPDHRAVLLAKAKQDRHVAELLETDLSVSDEMIGFHHQQAIEKSIKSVFAARNIEYPLTHDLARLLDLLRNQAIAFPATLIDAAALTLFAVRFRYDELAVVEADEPVFERAAAIALATLAIEWAEQFAQGG